MKKKKPAKPKMPKKMPKKMSCGGQGCELKEYVLPFGIFKGYEEIKKAA